MSPVRQNLPREPQGRGQPPDIDWPTSVPHGDAIARAAEILNAGRKVAILAGQGARGARAELEQVAEILGAGVAKPFVSSRCSSTARSTRPGAVVARFNG